MLFRSLDAKEREIVQTKFKRAKEMRFEHTSDIDIPESPASSDEITDDITDDKKEKLQDIPPTETDNEPK